MGHFPESTAASPTFGALLQHYRQGAGLTQEGLAERAGVSVRAISDLERGRRRAPYPHTLRALASALRLTSADRARLLAAVPTRRDAPPSTQVAPRPATNLPAALTSFIGRATELDEVRRRLVATRLLTLTGTGGVGKTRLSLEAARAVVDTYRDGVWLVELAALADPAQVPRTVAAVLGLREQSGQPILDTLLAACATRHLLLILDNCEHLLDGCATLAAALLRACPTLTILTTSREPLGVVGESTWHVPSLALPDLASAPVLADLAHLDAIRLFTERAGAADPSFALTADNAAAVAAICVRLDGIPLALELAATRVRSLPPARLVARLDDRFRLLTTGNRAALARQQTLRATVDWSYALLDAPERVLLRRLAVFAGGWTVDAAEAVCAWSARDAPNPLDVLDLLLRLADKSLVQAEIEGDEARYRLLETVRHYAAERLDEAGEADTARARHAAWCLTLADQLEPALFGDEQSRALGQLDAERDNLRAALAWSRERDPDTGLRLAGSLFRYWFYRGYATEGLGWLRSLLAASPARTLARVKALRGTGLMAMVLATRNEGVTAFLEAAALGRELGEASQVAWALRDAGQLLEWMGAYDRAEPLLAEAQALSRSLGDERGIGGILKMQAGVAAGRGDLRQAQRLADQALVHVRAVGDPSLLIHGLCASAVAVLGLGEADVAQARVAEALAAARSLGQSWAASFAWWHAGDVALWRGDFEQAIAAYATGHEAARQVADAHSLGRCLAGLGRVARWQGHPARAIELLEEALVRAERAEDRPGQGLILLSLALAAHDQGDAAGAGRLLADSLRLRRELGQRLGMAECLEGLATLASGTEQATAALHWLGAAEALREALGAPLPPVGRDAVASTLARLRAEMGDAASAAALAEGRTWPLDQAVAEALGKPTAAPVAGGSEEA